MRVASRAEGIREKLLEPDVAVLFCWGSNVKGSLSSLLELSKFFFSNHNILMVVLSVLPFVTALS